MMIIIASSEARSWQLPEIAGNIEYLRNRQTRELDKKMRIPCPILWAILCCVAAGTPSVCLGQTTGEVVTSSVTSPEFNVMGFGDISYISRDANDEDGFVIGQAVAHVTASLGNSFGVFAEFSLSAKDSEYSVEAERLMVKYDFSDRLKLSAGRYHTPIGYWNAAFHHGAWLQTSVERPKVVKFGSKIVPIHFVGVLLEGSLSPGQFGFSYKAGFGNGRHGNIARAGDAGDINGDKAWLVQLSSKPKALYGLQLGVSYYSDEVTLPDSPNVAEKTIAAHAAWTKESPEVILEYVHSEHELVTDSAVFGDVDAWYLQIGYRLPDSYSQWKPYARLEKTEVDSSDPLLGAEGLDYEAGVVGVRWDFNPYAALKAEYRNEEYDNSGRENSFALQVSFVLARL